MADRDYIRFRSTTDRELLLEKYKERTGIEEDSKAFDEALRQAMSFLELVDDLQADAMDAGAYDTEYHEVRIRSSLRRKKKA